MTQNTENGLIQATDYEVARFDIETSTGEVFDVRSICPLLEIFEDIDTPFIKMNFGLRDALGFVNTKIKGGEKVYLEFRTLTVSNRFIFKKEFIIYEISRREQTRPKEIAWQFECVTEEYVKNIDIKMSRSFKKKKSFEIIENILSNDLGSSKEFKYEEDILEQNYVTPYKHPFQTINFFKERSLNSKNHASYMFYENRDGFMFVSLSKLESQTPQQLYYRPDGISSKYPKYNIVEDYFPTDTAYDNIIENKKGGLEGTQGTFINLNDKSITSQGDNRTSQYVSVYSSDQNNNSKLWMENRNKNMTRFNSIIYNFVLGGSTLRTVGDVVYFNLPSAKSYGTSKNFVEDEKLAGLYIIKRVKHILQGSIYKQVIEVSKIQNEIMSNIQDNNFEEEVVDIPRKQSCAPMKLSKRGVYEILAHEGIVLDRYIDTAGVYTVGAGVTQNAGSSIDVNNFTGTLTIDQSIKLFEEIIGRYEDGVNEARNCLELKQHEFDALVSLAYNVGAGLGTMTKDLIREGNVVDAINLWRANRELWGRRDQEAELARSGQYSKDTILVYRAIDDVVIFASARNIPISSLNLSDNFV